MLTTIRTWYSKVVHYLKDVRFELRKVLWPSNRQTVFFTAIVIGAVVFVAGLIWVIDSAFGLVLAAIIR